MMLLDACFFCSTPLQVINSIQICYKSEISADLYILPNCPNRENLRMRVLAEKIFNEVRVVDSNILKKLQSREGNFDYKIKSFLTYCNVKKVADECLISGKKYRTFYFSSVTPYTKLLLLYFYKYCKDTEVCLMEDGEGSYDDPYIIGKVSKADYLARRLLFRYDVNKIHFRRKLYSPELYCSINGSDSLVEKIPNHFGELSFDAIIKRIFDADNKCIINEKFIILDVIKDIRFTQTGISKINHIYEIIESIAGCNNVIYKRHPRDNSKMDDKKKEYQYASIPFEVIELITNIENKVLISYASTAVFSSKIFFNKEPYVLLLNKLFTAEDILYNNEGIISGKVDRFNVECIKLYRDKSKFCIPKTEEELVSFLKRVVNDILHNQNKY